MPRTIEINNGMNNSNALVTPTRSEIRISFSIEYPSISDSTRKKLRRAAFVATFLLIVTVSSCSMLGVRLSHSMGFALIFFGSIGIVYCFHELWKAFGGLKGILNEEEKEAANE